MADARMPHEILDNVEGEKSKVRELQRKSPPFLFVIFLAAFFTTFGISCRNQPAGETESSEIKVGFEIREGKRLFLHYCAPCHGENAQGSGRYFPSRINPQPPDLVGTDYLQKTDEDVVLKAIKFGSSALGKTNFSPPYGQTLRDEEINFIISFLSFLNINSQE